MKKPPYRTLALLAGVLLAIIAPFCLFGAAIDAWTGRLLVQAEAHRLYTGALLTLLLAADILLPVPSSLVSAACGMLLGLVGGTCASFLGMSLSTVAGYVLGRTASATAERMIGSDEVTRLRAFHARHGVWLLLALRPVPVLAEASVLFSGLSRQPLSHVLAVTALGNAAVSLVYAAVGAWGRLSGSFLPAFCVVLLLSGTLVLGLRNKRTRPPTSPGG